MIEPIDDLEPEILCRAIVEVILNGEELGFRYSMDLPETDFIDITILRALRDGAAEFAKKMDYIILEADDDDVGEQ